jgi:hypothetical protein
MSFAEQFLTGGTHLAIRRETYSEIATEIHGVER